MKLERKLRALYKRQFKNKAILIEAIFNRQVEFNENFAKNYDGILREYKRRVVELFETADQLDKLKKMPTFLIFVSLALGFFAFFSTSQVIKALFILVLILVLAGIILGLIVRRDFRYKIVEQIADVENFSETYRVTSSRGESVVEYAKALL